MSCDVVFYFIGCVLLVWVGYLVLGVVLDLMGKIVECFIFEVVLISEECVIDVVLFFYVLCVGVCELLIIGVCVIDGLLICGVG